MAFITGDFRSGEMKRAGLWILALMGRIHL